MPLLLLWVEQAEVWEEMPGLQWWLFHVMSEDLRARRVRRDYVPPKGLNQSGPWVLWCDLIKKLKLSADISGFDEFWGMF